MTGLWVGSTYCYGTYSYSHEYDFGPQFCLAYGGITSAGWGDGNGSCAIQQYRQRQADGSDPPTNFSGYYWDSPQNIAVDNCTSVTFFTYINNGGYIVTNEVLTFW
jgi:hypothetical protein